MEVCAGAGVVLCAGVVVGGVDVGDRMTQGDGYKEDELSEFITDMQCDGEFAHLPIAEDSAFPLPKEREALTEEDLGYARDIDGELVEVRRKMPEQKPFPKDIMFSTGKDNWQTPIDFFTKQHRKHQFTIDGAADSTNHLLPRWFGPGGEREDALEGEWPFERVWINPPYSIGAKFLDKAVNQVLKRNVERVVLLLPARTDTKAFHRCVWNKEKCQPREWVRELDLVQGRIKFINPDNPLLRKPTASVIEGRHAPNNSAPFPSMVVWMELVS